MRLRSERIITPAGTVAGEVSIESGRIAAVVPARACADGVARTAVRADGPAEDPGDSVIDLGRKWLAPGYIDTHVHGGGGAQCNSPDPDEFAAVARFHATHGTTALLATTVSAPPDELCAALEAIGLIAGRDDRPRDGAQLLGAHLEGPFLSRRRPGAMDPETFLEPNRGTLERLLVAGAGTARMMTVAPELPDGLELVAALVSHEVVASVGHSDAAYDEVRRAVAAGVRAATHTFNAMAPLHHREPGVVGAVLDLPQISCELICDGVHVSPAAMRLAYRAKGAGGIRLVTDAIQGAGMPDGEYRLGGAGVTVRDGRARLAGGDLIAGSTLTMDEAVRGAIGWLGLSVEQAVGLAAANPARLLGLEHRKGAIAPGLDADLIVLDDELRVRATIVGGEWVHGAPAGVAGA